jgi:hypothetical protein
MVAPTLGRADPPVDTCAGCGPPPTTLAAEPEITAWSGALVAVIEQVGAREILDSRGNPTVEVEVTLA